MTKKLFEEDVMCRECRAAVLECRPLKKGFGIVLDQTVFFPEGGGQLSDTGWLAADGERIPVAHVRTQEGTILHETQKALPVGCEVTALLDWPARFDHMQQHCGEHLLSYAFWKLFGADNVGFHMNPEIVTVDLNKEVTEEQVHEAETMANLHIQENRAIQAEWLEPAEAARLTMRKFNGQIAGRLRIVSVAGSDVCTCCGTHPPVTGMVGLVKVFKTEKHKQGTRVYFLCGRLALQEISRRLGSLAEAARLLSVKDEEIDAAVIRLREENRQLREKLQACSTVLAEAKVQELLRNPPQDAAGNLLLTVLSGELDAAGAKVLAKRLSEVPKARAAVAYEANGRVNYILALGEGAAGSCRELLQQINTALDGHGGGRDSFAQGSAPVREGWQRILAQQLA